MTDPAPVPAGAAAPGVAVRHKPALTAAQRLCLLAAIALAAGGATIWNELTARPAVVPVFNGGLDPAVLARSGLQRSALQWITIRTVKTGYEVDFAPMLENAAALASVRYGVDRFEPDRTLVLPPDRHVWPVPPQRFGIHVIVVPTTSRVVSVSVTYLDGTSAPVLIYPLGGRGP